MRVDVRTKRLGPCSSEGVRLLWQVIGERGWSHRELAEAVGVEASSATRWLHADRRPGLKHAVAIEAFLGIPMGAWHTRPRRPIRLRLPRAA